MFKFETNTFGLTPTDLTHSGLHHSAIGMSFFCSSINQRATAWYIRDSEGRLVGITRYPVYKADGERTATETVTL